VNKDKNLLVFDPCRGSWPVYEKMIRPMGYRELIRMHLQNPYTPNKYAIPQEPYNIREPKQACRSLIPTL
jgi:hypothetical protein